MEDPGSKPIPEASELAPDSLEHAPQPASDLWTLRDLLFFICFALFAFPLSSLLGLVAYVVIKPITGWQTPLVALWENPFFLLTLQSVFYALLLGFVYLLVALNFRQPFWRALKWRMPTARQSLRFILGGILLALTARFFPTLLPEQQDFPLERLFSSPAAAYAIGAFAILVAPFMEELIFRGVLFSIFERQVGPSFAVASTALLFGGLHVPEYWGAWNHVLMILVVGLVFSLARGWTGSLAPSVLLHLGYNASQVAVLFFATHRFQTFQAFLPR